MLTNQHADGCGQVYLFPPRTHARVRQYGYRVRKCPQPVENFAGGVSARSEACRYRKSLGDRSCAQSFEFLHATRTCYALVKSPAARCRALGSINVNREMASRQSRAASC